eukprot:Lithocolla_globosa_v1_NODE_1078_length_2891_cov_45.242948.p2 type:complete len:242 gc:universal NODE_1078_length_2891_cov_45.242948:1929-2654(+)
MTEVNQQTKTQFGCDRSGEQQYRIACPDFLSHIVCAPCCFALVGDLAFLSDLLRQFLAKLQKDHKVVFSTTDTAEKLVVISIGEVESYQPVCCCGKHTSLKFARRKLVPYVDSAEAPNSVQSEKTVDFDDDGCIKFWNLYFEHQNDLRQKERLFEIANKRKIQSSDINSEPTLSEQYALFKTLVDQRKTYAYKLETALNKYYVDFQGVMKRAPLPDDLYLNETLLEAQQFYNDIVKAGFLS